MASSGPPGLPSTTAGAGTAAPAASSSTAATMNPKMRKRTKTGCLTCRKRRIKCGEERPICNNCIKSKRQCEGYNQRVIFKQPMGHWPDQQNLSTALPYHTAKLPGDSRRHGNHQDSHLIHPRPVSHFDFNVESTHIPGLDTSGHHHGLVGGQVSYPQDQTYHAPLQSPSSHGLPTPTSATTTYFTPQASPLHTNYPGHYIPEGGGVYQASQQYSQNGHYQQQVPVSYDTHHPQQRPSISEASHPVTQAYPEPSIMQQQQQQQPQRRDSSIPENQNPYGLATNIRPRPEEYPSYVDHRPPSRTVGIPYSQGPPPQPSPASMTSAGPYQPPTTHQQSQHNALQTHSFSAHPSYQPSQIPPHTHHDISPDVKYVAQHTVLETSADVGAPQPQLLTAGFGGEDHTSPTTFLDDAAVEIEDTNYYDVYSDEGGENRDEDMPDRDDIEDDGDNLDRVGSDLKRIVHRDFSLILRLHEESTSALAIRRYDSFIYHGILDHYRAEKVANPLRNPNTARVFAHFVHVTGPCLSIFERSPRNPMALFGGHTPTGMQNLWTYIVPSIALNNQGLLHALLALASLHIARLQRASITPSYRHYAYAIKRLNRYLPHPKKRLQLSTLATSLLLAYYEVMTAEHVKWSAHLVGARLLITELDFRTMTQQARRLRAERAAQEQQFSFQNPDMLLDRHQLDQQLKDASMMPDAELVSQIVGKQVNYDNFGRVVEEDGNRRRDSLPLKDLDLATYETFQDLYWWYCRQDAYQSMISARHLNMDYRKWSDCPPRAPLGRVDALYGTHDHIMLLIGRIADFTRRDRDRKLRQAAADGGSWKPGPGLATVPGMPMGPPPPHGQGQTPSGTNGPQNMHGMGPPPGWSSGGGGGQPVNAKGQGQVPPGQSPNFAHAPPAQNQGPPSQGPPQRPAQGPPQGTPGAPPFFGMAPTRGESSTPTQHYANTPFHKASSPSASSPGSTTSRSSIPLSEAYSHAITEWTSIYNAYQSISTQLTTTPSLSPLAPNLHLHPPTTPFGPPLVYRTQDIAIIWSLLHFTNIILLRAHPSMPAAAMIAASVASPATHPSAMLIGRISAGLSLPSSPSTPLNPALGAALIESSLPLFFAGVQFQDPAQREWLIERLLEIDGRTGWASAGTIARSCETCWERAAEARRGPGYWKRRTRRVGEHGPVVLGVDEVGAGSAGGGLMGGGGGGGGGREGEGRNPGTGATRPGEGADSASTSSTSSPPPHAIADPSRPSQAVGMGNAYAYASSVGWASSSSIAFSSHPQPQQASSSYSPWSSHVKNNLSLNPSHQQHSHTNILPPPQSSLYPDTTTMPDSDTNDHGHGHGHDKRFILRSKPQPWAMGLMAADEDLREEAERVREEDEG